MNRFLSVLSIAAIVVGAQAGFGQAPLEQAISAKFPLTKPNADHSDIVTAGSVVVLKKDGLVAFATDAPTKSQVSYRDGKLQSSAVTKMSGFKLLGQSSAMLGHPTSNISQHTFVAGEKLWLIGVQTVGDGVQLTLLSDPIKDARYQTIVKFPFPKGSTPAPDVVIAQISEFMATDDSSGKDTGGSAASGPAPASAPAAPPPAPMADIPPPPPPADAPVAPPPTLEKGMTKDQVVAGFGAPQKVVKMGTKEIDYYKDMKVTYVAGKVSNVE